MQDADPTRRRLLKAGAGALAGAALGALPLPSRAASNGVELPFQAQVLVHDASRGLIYAGVPADAPDANDILAIDDESFEIVQRVFKSFAFSRCSIFCCTIEIVDSGDLCQSCYKMLK